MIQSLLKSFHLLYYSMPLTRMRDDNEDDAQFICKNIYLNIDSSSLLWQLSLYLSPVVSLTLTDQSLDVTLAPRCWCWSPPGPEPGETARGGDETGEDPDQDQADPEHHRPGTQQPQLSAPEASLSQTWSERVRGQTSRSEQRLESETSVQLGMQYELSVMGS